MTALEGLFAAIARMSITASWAAVGVIVVRFALRRLPKAFSYALWAVVLFRLLCPVSISSPVSALGVLGRAGATDAAVGRPAIGTIIAPATQSVVHDASGTTSPAVGPTAPVPGANPSRPLPAVLSLIWAAGALALLSHSVVSYLRMINRLQTATLVAGNIYESDRVGTAFVLGFIRPRIIMPASVAGTNLSYILEHEHTHIRRRDHLIKPLAFLALSIHWFNPLMWLSFVLMGRDMEMSCDEHVLRTMGNEAKSGYSGSLLSLSAPKPAPLAANPLAFGESHVGARIRNVLAYHKPSLWAVLAGIVVLAVVAAGFMTDPRMPFDLEKTRAAAMLFATGETDPVTIGEVAARHYHAAFMGSGIPTEYRITRYEPKSVSLLAGDAQEFCVQVTSDYSATGLYWLSANGAYKPVANGYDCEADYHEFRIKKVGDGEYQIVDIGTGGCAQGLVPANPDERAPDTGNVATGDAVEASLTAIMSSPLTSSNPEDYINAHQDECEKIVKLGDDALSYMLSRFAGGDAAGLRGQVMMRLCRRLLGPRDNVTGDGLSPHEWYAALDIREETRLPDFAYDGNDSVERLVYATEVMQNAQPNRGFTVVAPHIHGSYEEGDWLKVFTTTYSACYRLYGNVLVLECGSVVPAAISYKNDGAGSWVFARYEQAKDGSDFASSIREFCTMPASGSEIAGLADAIIRHYGDYSDIRALQQENLRRHLAANGVTDATLSGPDGAVDFSLK